MDAFGATTFINRPLEEVFDFMTSPAYMSQWQSGTKSAQWASEGPVGVGSIVHLVTALLGREMTLDAEITQWDPPSVWGIKASNGPMKIEVTTRFESQDGGTLVIQDGQGELGGLFNIAEGLAIKQMQKQGEVDAQTLKQMLEASQ